MQAVALRHSCSIALSRSVIILVQHKFSGESISYLGVIVPWNRLIQSIMIEAIMFSFSGLALLIFETLSQKTSNKLLWLRLFSGRYRCLCHRRSCQFFPLPRELPLPIEMLPVDLFMRVFICVIYATLMYTYLNF